MFRKSIKYFSFFTLFSVMGLLFPVLAEESKASTQNEFTSIEKKEISQNSQTVKSELKSQIWQKPKVKHSLDFQAVFKASPVIYSILMALSIFASSVWLYTMLSFRTKKVIDKTVVSQLKIHLHNSEFDKALEVCQKSDTPLSSMLASGLLNRKRGYQMMIEAIRSEGERITSSKWQKLAWLNDIVVVAPMLGLLGTILGIFYAFYDIHRSVESIVGVFDGIGIAVGTTVAGLIVAILAMVLHATLRSHLAKVLNLVENETVILTQAIKE